jgi:hypothetical protein
MKKLILSTVLLLAVCAVSFGTKVVASGQTFTALGDYRIETVDNAVSFMGKDCEAYLIRYQNSPLEVKIIICKEKNCRKYLVLSDKLSVQYVCNKDYFGVEKLDKVFEKEGFVTSDAYLDRLEYFHQKVLGAGQKSVLEATQLIAAFYPQLIKPEVRLTAAI